jgi:ribonuclease Z
MMWRWAALVVSVLLVAVAAGAFLFQRQIGEAIFRQAVAENVGRDRGAELPDGLHVFMCGSGSPMPDPARAGPCVGVIAGSHAMVFDIGSGGARRLARMGFPVGRLEKIYLTHLHSDHIDGLGELMLQAWVGGSRSTPRLRS